MLKIKNNEWQRFSNAAIIVIADELGCPYEYPKMGVVYTPLPAFFFSVVKNI